MSRLIDADILDDEVMNLFISITGNPKQHTVVNECKSSFRRMIEEQPPVEAVPVVHGEWVNEYINRYGHPCHCCSVCGFHASYQDKNFCPECGADMRISVE